MSDVPGMGAGRWIKQAQARERPGREARQRRFAARTLAVCLLWWIGGCWCCNPSRPGSGGLARDSAYSAVPADARELCFPERIDQGYTIVLPGIWGSAPLDHGIVKGLIDADVPSAIELYDWTVGPLWLVYNLRALDRNRIEAQKIAGKIVAYQDRYPGRPVNLIGYSGGGGVAVLTLEALPPDRRITKAILLAPTLAQDYDLGPALRHTEHGIHNFHSPIDVPMLVVLTTALGTTEGRHAPSAGAFGFAIPQGRDGSQDQEHAPRLVQHQYALDMIGSGHPGGHFGWTSRIFIAKWVAPILCPSPESEAPAGVAPRTGGAQVAVTSPSPPRPGSY